MEASELIGTVEAMHTEARERELFFLNAEDETLSGRTITLDGRELVSFSSCSYLGLERHPALVKGVHDAVDRWGTQFSSSRGYVSAPPYRALEERLSELFGGHALVTCSTSMGHQIALSILATEKDAVVLDHQVHHSVQMAATLARAQGAHVELIRHSELDRAEDLVARLARSRKTVWFACDGVFSMYGDLAPVRLLQRLLDLSPNVMLYVDDAHGMSWAGEHGRGSFLSRFAQRDRVVLATSLNKAFSASGGVLVFPTREERERVRMCGGPMVFSGPLQPPMLGAALASAALHLSPEITRHQRELRARVDQTNKLLRVHGLPLLVENESPIFFVRMGLPKLAFDVARRMKDDGFYVNVSMYPSVPMKRAGIRLAVTAAHTPEQVSAMLGRLAEHVPAVLKDHGVSRAELDALFERAIPLEARTSMLPPPTSARDAVLTLFGRYEARPANDGLPVASNDGPTLTVEHHRTIHKVDKREWDGMLGEVGACSWDAQSLLERVFRAQPKREHRWAFDYVIVRDEAGRPVAATSFSTSLVKDDMLVRESVSRAVESRRTDDPYFLTSMACMTGSQLSEGKHLWLDRKGPWRQALGRLLEVGTEVYERSGAGLAMLRDLPADDPEMDAYLLDAGFVKVPMFDSHHLTVDFTDDAGLLARLGKRARSHVRGLMERSRDFVVKAHGVGSDTPERVPAELFPTLYQLYRNVAARKLRLNVFALPEDLIPALQQSTAWELLTVSLKPEAGGPADGRPVAWCAAHVHGGSYAPFFCGLDYDHVYNHGAYRQLLLAIVRRARERGLHTVHMGMDADMEKSRFGTVQVKNCLYVQVRDHFHGELLREIAAEVGVADVLKVA
ncbi:MAG: GNAT family N-acetyltransferase [Deltaproteobacteria bacterium]|nr:GNAT family N-acetyltransferase [Deltaproteobacteria bacterium]